MRLDDSEPGPREPQLGWIHRTWPNLVLVAASLVVPLALFVIVSWSDRDNVLRDMEQNARRTADTFTQQASSVFETHELIAREIDEHVRGMSWDEIAESAAVHDFLAQIKRQYPQVEGLGLVDPEGNLRSASNEFPVTSFNIADRAYFATLRARDAGTVISGPLLGHLQRQWRFDVARRRSSPSGAFDGAIIVVASPAYFAEFWRRTAPPLQTATALVRPDRKVLAAEPLGLGNEVTPHSGATIQLTGDQGTFLAVSEVDGVERFFTFRRLAPYDLYIEYGVGVHAGLGDWRDDLVVYAEGFGAAAVALIFASLLALRRARREQAAARGRLAAERQLHQAQKMEALGQFTGGIAHDFNNLLTAIIGNLDMLRGRLGNERHEDRLRRAFEAAERGERTVQSLLTFVRREPQRSELIAVGEVCEEMDGMFRQAIGSRNQLETIVSPAAWPVKIDKNQLELALLNIIVNARDAMPEPGTVTIIAENVTLAGLPNGLRGDFLSIAISDTGTGIAPDALSKIFEPFFTTKEQGKGTGLGLAQVYGLATQSGGVVTVRSALGEGTSITLYLPRARQEAAPRPAPATAARRGLVILVVEDESSIREMAAEALRGAGHVVIEASNGDEALALIEHDRSIDLLFTDIRMPGRTTGIALAKRARRIRPDLKILFATGHVEDVRQDDGTLAAASILAKPFRPGQVVRAIERARAA